MPYALPALTTLFALLLYIMVSINVARARERLNVPAPATTGDPEFERIYRVQMNTLEQLVAFLPALWLFAVFINAAWAALLGTVWIIGRVLYALSYYRAAESRGPGFVTAFGAFGILWLGALWGAVRALLAG
jgi:glutathione S-transferase